MGYVPSVPGFTPEHSAARIWGQTGRSLVFYRMSKVRKWVTSRLSPVLSAVSRNRPRFLGIATLPAGIGGRIGIRNGQLNRLGSGSESGTESARETPPDWRLKERTLSAPHPVGRSTYPETLTRSRIASSGHPGTPRAGTLPGSLSHFTSMFVIRSTSRAHFNRGSAGRYTNFP